MKIKQIAAGENHSLILTESGYVFKIGKNVYDATKVPDAAKSGVIAVSAGSYFSLALKDTGEVLSWGMYYSPCLEVPEAAKSGVIAISAGYEHCLALKNDGSVIAWGNNEFGQCDVPDAAKSGVLQIKVGKGISLAIKENGLIVYWGQNEDYQSYLDTCRVKNDIALSANHFLLINDCGKVEAFGDNYFYECDIPENENYDIVKISVSFSHCLALKQDSTVIAWGLNARASEILPKLENIVDISAGGCHGLALTKEGKVIAWGDKIDGQCDVDFINDYLDGKWG